MEFTTLGRTGLRVSVAGLGCGGPSRLGLRNDPQSLDDAVGLIRLAINLGVNFIDTAQSYGTEEAVGKAIAGVPRDRIVISTKKTLPSPASANPAKEIVEGLERSLQLIGTDYIDVYHLHGVEPKDYQFALDRLMPAMRQLKEQGKIRAIGVTEGFVVDPAHSVLERGLQADLWDVVMVGFSILNPSARKTVLPLAETRNVGVLNMFAVRRALSQPERLRKICAELIASKQVSQELLNADDPLSFLLEESDAATLPEAAYRFCRHEPGIDVVLFGTGNPDHLSENVEAILKPPLPPHVLEKLMKIFGNLDHLTGN